MAATNLRDSVTVTRTKIWKGTFRLVVSDPDEYTSFPGRIESVIATSASADDKYTLASGLTDLGPTTTDGLTVRRTAELSDGIELDQRRTNLDEGEPDTWAMSCEATLRHTDLDNFGIAWEGGTQRTHAANGTHVAQHSLALDAPQEFTARMLFAVQEDPSNGNMRVFAFRDATPAVDSESVLGRTEATNLPLTMTLRADTSIDENSGQFGMIFEEDA